MTNTTLMAASGHYLCAEGGGGSTAVADRSEAGPWEQWTVHTYDDGRVSLQAASTGLYLCAEPDGTVIVNRSESGEYERFTYELRDVGVAFKSFHGTYLQAPQGGGTPQPLVCVGDDPNLPGVWEFFVSTVAWWTPPEVPNKNRLSGPLVRNGRVVGDDTGPRILMCCHFMEAFSAFCHNKTHGSLDVRTQLEIIAEEYAAIRVLDVLGYWDSSRPGDSDYWVAWQGRAVTPISFIANSGATIPATPDYWDRKREFITMCHELGLRVMDDRGDMNSFTRDQKIGHMRANGAFYESLPFGREVLLGMWSINEAWQNGGDDVHLLIDMLHAFEEGAGWMPPICGLSAPGGHSDPAALAETDPLMTSWEPEMPDSFDYWSQEPATALTIHGNRGDHYHIVEHYWCYGYDEQMRGSGNVAFNTEPVGPGPGVSVGQVNDTELLCTLTAAALSTGQAWTYMSGFGVFWDGPIHEQPGFTEVARLPTFLPNDIATWPVVCHSGSRWAGLRILAAVDPTRADHSIAEDGRFAIVVHTQDGPGRTLPCERPCSDFRVINLVTGAVEREGPLAVGETYQHGGTGRLVVGQLAPEAAAATMSTWAVETAPGKPPRRAGRVAWLLKLFGGRGWSS